MSELESLSTEKSTLNDLSTDRDVLDARNVDDDSDHPFLLDPIELSDSKAEGERSDIFSLEVMAASRNVALYCIITIALCMAACSFIMLHLFDVAESSRNKSTTDTDSAFDASSPEVQDSDGVCEESLHRAELPLWERIFEYQIHVIQNLIHASLIGSAAVVAAIRGDALWMYYVRNVAFFFVPIGSLYFFLDVRSIWIGETDLMDHMWRLPLSFLTAIAGVVAFVAYTPVFLRIRRMICERTQTGVLVDTTCRYPSYLAENVIEANLATVIYSCATIAQVVAWIFYATTISYWFTELSSPCDSKDPTSESGEHEVKSDLEAFEMAYSSGSHQALLLALCFLAATYPRDMASAGGALLTSSWRTILAVGSLLHLLADNEAEKALMSWVNTSVEIALMSPILVASSILVYRIIQRPEYHRIKSLSISSKETNLDDGLCFECASLTQISRSSRFSHNQRRGARVLRFGTVLLLTELTAECIIMLRYNSIGTDMTHEVYKWGMHICVMHIFCAIMCVETPFIYHQARKLLLAACPSGSLVAMWQLSTLVQHSPDVRNDVLGQVAACLLMLRAISGIVQTAGLFRLTDLQSAASKALSAVTSTCPDKRAKSETRLKRLRGALWGVYLPVVVVYIFVFALLGNCNPPMMSAGIASYECSETPSTALPLAQNWPGFGLVFHYGMIVVISAANGAQKSPPTYKPSLFIASLFCVHVAALILFHLCWDAVQTDMWSVLALTDVIRRVLVLLWMLASLLLWICCERVLKVRVVSV